MHGMHGSLHSVIELFEIKSNWIAFLFFLINKLYYYNADLMLIGTNGTAI